MSNVVEQHNLGAQAVWNSPAGRYDEISRSIADAIEHAVDRLAPASGTSVLDLATGTGWASRSIARRNPNVKVTGADIADVMLEHARTAAQKEGLPIEYRHADAEKLPFADASFDSAISTFGVMFVGRPEAAAAELARVVKPGGRVVLATWCHDSNVFEMFKVLKRHMPPPPPGAAPPPPSPFEWGRSERLNELLASSFDLAIEQGTNHFRYDDPADAWTLWVNSYGPIKSLAARLDDAGREALRRDLIAWHETFRGGLGFDQPRTYLITRAVRRR